MIAKAIDCVVCGEACIDLAIRPIPRDRPLADVDTQYVQPIHIGTGGIVPNAAAAMARLGLNVAALCVVGDDDWGRVIGDRLASENVDIRHVVARPKAVSSVTAVLIDAQGEHTFAFHPGASQSIDREICFEQMELFAQSRWALFGYYNLLPHLEHNLPEVLAAVRAAGCKTALDAANGGGSMTPLDRILPHLDVYFPSYAEARQQTGEDDPQAMLREYRRCATHALLGVKLGDRGAMISPDEDTFIAITPIKPPGPIVDTTGAGDTFYAGLIAGLCHGMSAERAALLGAATGACCVTGVGACEALRDYEATAALLPK
jgi:ribokinase